ncbi:hypothetical protein PVAP13_1KG021700 [Panicum virgatum]|uniref:Uncharacterized protein n=1 Tax=Panicum virgatum TaxID=38727 RepID=A0A8T0X0Z8_PANVG|nr:hypothetical protein PVAP13_1KG021700 [Panicum virgatum]
MSIQKTYPENLTPIPYTLQIRSISNPTAALTAERSMQQDGALHASLSVHPSSQPMDLSEVERKGKSSPAPESRPRHQALFLIIGELQWYVSYW